MKGRPITLPLLGASLLLLLAACGGGEGSTTETVPGATAPTVEAQVTLSAEEAGEAEVAEAESDGPREVTIETADGITLGGTLFGTGDTAIVFSHMFSTEQTSWQPFAEVAAEQGYLALTYDFRGYGASGGDRNIPAIDGDVRAAYDFVKAQGAQRVILVGAEMGGIASIKVAATLQDELTALILLSSPQSFEGLESTQEELAALTMPSLWLSARTDMVTTEFEDMFDVAGGDKSMWIFEGSGVRGTFIFDTPLDGEDLTQRLLDFLAQVAPVGP